MLRTGRGQITRLWITTESTMNLKAHSINQDARRKREEVLHERVTQTLSRSGNQFNIERLKALEATTFKRTTNPAETERWLSLIFFWSNEVSRRKKSKVSNILVTKKCRGLVDLVCNKSKRSRFCYLERILGNFLPSFIC